MNSSNQKIQKDEKLKALKNDASTLSALDLEILTSEKRLQAVVKSHHTLIKISLIFGFVSLLTIVMLFIVVVRHKSHNRYFATTSNGRIFQLTPLNEPLLSLQAVEDFAARAISNTFTFDYANYRKQITANINSFTPKAFAEIKTNLESSNGIVTQAIKHSWVVTTNVMAAPTVPMQGKYGNRYAWRLIFPLKMTFQSETSINASRYTADIVVERINQKDNPQGVAITSLTLTPYRYE